MPTNAKKLAYAAKLHDLIDNSKNVFIISVDNVGSKQMQTIRKNLRGQAVVLMGKNTTIRKVIADYLAKNPDHPIAALQPYIRLNVGFVFTNADIGAVRTVVTSNRVPAPARPGAIAPEDVYVEPGPTGCDPGQTNYFQSMNVPTKIVRGQIEITSRVLMCVAGDKVSPTAAALLDKLNIKPFSFGVVVNVVYSDGVCFDPRVLDLSEIDLINKFRAGVNAIAAIGMEVGFPTIASLPHSLTNAFSNMLAITLETDFDFPQASAYITAVTSAAAAAPAGGAAAGGAPAADAAPEPSSSSSAGGAAADLFGGSGSSSDDSSS